MKQQVLSEAISNIRTEYIEKAADYAAAKKPRKSAWWKIGTMAACLCLVVGAVLATANSSAAGNTAELLNVTTAPPDGLVLTIVSAAPDDAEFLIENGTDFQVTYGRAFRVERHDGENWTEVLTESEGIFPATVFRIQPGHKMYGMCGWMPKRLILEPGLYRYLLVVEISEADAKPYPVVLKAEFEIQ